MSTMVKFYKKKDGQMKIQQMAFVLLAITLFFVMVGLIVVLFAFSGIKSGAQSQEEENAILLSMKIANSPEFSCGDSYGSGKINCIDMDKVIVLKEMDDNYEDFWGVSNIGIYRVYPREDKDIECSIGNYPNCDYIRIYDNEIGGYGQAKNFVTLCMKESSGSVPYDKCELGLLVIEEKEVED